MVVSAHFHSIKYLPAFLLNPIWAGDTVLNLWTEICKRKESRYQKNIICIEQKSLFSFNSRSRRKSKWDFNLHSPAGCRGRTYRVTLSKTGTQRFQQLVPVAPHVCHSESLTTRCGKWQSLSVFEDNSHYLGSGLKPHSSLIFWRSHSLKCRGKSNKFKRKKKKTQGDNVSQWNLPSTLASLLTSTCENKVADVFESTIILWS